MISQEKIERINALARKQKSEGLTPEEKTEQDTLRREYIDAVKGNLRSQLDCVKPDNEQQKDGASHSSGCSCGCGHHHHDH